MIKNNLLYKTLHSLLVGRQTDQRQSFVKETYVHTLQKGHHTIKL